MNKCDGHIRKIAYTDLVPGAVLRMIQSEEGAIAPFSDCVVVDIETKTARDDSIITLARPMAFATSFYDRPGISGQAPAVQFERIRVQAARLVEDHSIFRLVIQANGQNFCYKH